MRFTLPLATFLFLSLLQVTLPNRVLADGTLQLLEPNGGESFIIGQSVTVRWVIPYPEFESELAFSGDGGAHWNAVADHLTGESYVWHPSAASLHGLLRVAHSNTGSIYGTDTSDAEFVVHGKVENVRFALHRKNPERYPTVLCDDPSTSTVEPNYSPNYDHIPCSQYTVNAPLGGSTVYIVVGQADPAEGVVGASFGISYNGHSACCGFPASGIDPRYVSFNSCTEGIYFDSGGFPRSGGGLRILWGFFNPESCQREVIGSEGVHAVIGSLYVYAYSSALLRLTPNTSAFCCGELGVMTCVGLDNSSVTMTNLFDVLSPEEVNSRLGSVQFGAGTGGYTPCSAGTICSIGATDMDVKPNNLNLNSGAKFVSASIELPSGYDPAGVPVGTVKVNGSVEATEFTLGDFNHNGVSDFTVKFLRQEVESILSEGDRVQVTITGAVGDDCTFAGTEFVRVIRPHVVHPNGGELYAPGATALVQWTNPNGWSVGHAQIYYSADGGDTWAMVADQVTGESYELAVPQEATQNGRIRVVLFDPQGVMGYDTSDGPFTISAATGVEPTLPTRHRLYQNSPNPFYRATKASFDLPEPGHVMLKVFDLTGRVVRVLADGDYPAGTHEVSWNALDAGGKSVSAGIYFLHIAAGTFTDTKRMYLSK